MTHTRSTARSLAAFATLVLLLAACGGAPPTAGPTQLGSTAPVSNAPVSAAPVSAAPTPPPDASQTPSAAPNGAASLDPSLSDAGVVARVTIENDAFGDRTGTYDVVGLEADGSECSPSFDGEVYSAVAWVDDAPNGQIHRFSVTVKIANVPVSDGQTADILDGRVSFDFMSETGVGTQYTGDATQDGQGSSTIDVTRSGDSVTFDFEGQTYVGVPFYGQVICAEG